MGFTGTILAANPSAAIDVERVLSSFGFREPESVREGWVIDAAPHHPDQAVEYFEPLVARIGGPALVAEVFDSDIAYLTVGTPESEPVVVILTPKALRAEGVPLPSSRAQKSAVEAFATWSSAAPRPITAERLRDMIKAGNTFAEETVWELLSELRIRPLPDSEEAPSLDVAGIEQVGAGGFTGFLKPLSWMGPEVTYRGRGVAWKDYRFLPGQGNAFYGIWDRRRGANPLLIYPKSLRGHENLLRDFDHLDARLDLGDAADQFNGLLGVLANGLYPGGRELRLTDSRYIPGWGRGFSGVWDREGGPEPIVRFKAGEAGRDRAEQWVRSAMMPILARAKIVGPDRWISRVRDDPYDSSGTSKGVLWLLLYEEADASWTPHGTQGMERDGYVLQQVLKLEDGFDLFAGFGLPEPDRTAAMHTAALWDSKGDWLPVPADVPLTLYETARWAVEDSPHPSWLVPHPSRGR